MSDKTLSGTKSEDSNAEQEKPSPADTPLRPTGYLEIRNQGQNLFADFQRYFTMPETLPSSQGCIVFSCGTIVDLSCENPTHHPIVSFTANRKLDRFLKADFPSHRLPSLSYSDIRTANQNDLEWISTNSSFAEQCRKAWGCLMWSGYPLPGGPAADRILYPRAVDPETEMLCFETVFHNLGECCRTLLLFRVDEQELETYFQNTELPRLQKLEVFLHSPSMRAAADHHSAESRRLDYMFPKPFAFIDANKTVHKL